VEISKYVHLLVLDYRSDDERWSVDGLVREFPEFQDGGLVKLKCQGIDWSHAKRMGKKKKENMLSDQWPEGFPARGFHPTCSTAYDKADRNAHWLVREMAEWNDGS
jgi:hypothetical protein